MNAIFSKKKIALNIALALAAGVITVGCAGNSVKPSESNMQSSEVSTQQNVVAETPKTDTSESAMTQENKPVEVSAVESTPAQTKPAESTTVETEKTIPEATTETAEIIYPDIEIKEAQKPEQLSFQFGFDKAEVSENDVEIIKQHAKYLLENSEVMININGHTDHHGPKVYNEYLSKKRADAVAKILLQEGVNESQIKISALANAEPLQDVKHARMNRRVELKYTEMNFVSTK